MSRARSVLHSNGDSVVDVAAANRHYLATQAARLKLAASDDPQTFVEPTR
jgi:hypothetical protein